MKYTAILEFSQEDEVYLVRVPAFPQVHTYGEDAQKATDNAKEAIELAIEVYRDAGKSLPYDPAVVVAVAP